jgi:hypothetical protein
LVAIASRSIACQHAPGNILGQTGNANNVFNRAPPMVGGSGNGGTHPIFCDVNTDLARRFPPALAEDFRSPIKVKGASHAQSTLYGVIW